MSSYTQLFSSILDSSIWQESISTRIVWITMLGLCNDDGIVTLSFVELARRAGVTTGACAAALKILTAPDKYNQFQEFQGRRIKMIDNGWLILGRGEYF